VLEKRLPLAYEVSVIVARGPPGQGRALPIAAEPAPATASFAVTQVPSPEL